MPRTLRLLAPLLAPLLLIACAPRAVHRSAVHAPDLRWAAIDSLAGLGLFASALQLTDEVLRTADAEGDWREAFRAHMYRALYQLRTGTERPTLIAAWQERLRAGTDPAPLRALLHSVCAQAIWQHYQAERWRVLDRQGAGDSTDMATWDQQRYMDRVIAHVHASLGDRDSLLAEATDGLGALLLWPEADGPAARHTAVALRPTLYDLLAHRALEIFTHPETRLREPADRFRLDDPSDLDLFDDFAYRRRSHPDSGAWEYQALRLFMDLTRLHLRDDAPDALVDLDLLRLAWVHRHSSLPARDTLLTNALNTLRSRLPRDSAWAAATHALAEHHATLGARHQRLGGDAYRYDRRRAVALCDSVLARWPATLAARRCAALRERLLAPAISLTTEAALEPGLPFLVNTTWTHVDTLHWRIVETSPTADEGTDDQQTFIRQLLARKPLREGHQPLPDGSDLNEHVADLPFDGLPRGAYMLLASARAGFRPDHDPIVFTPLLATRIGVVEREHSGEGTELLLVDRWTGAPLPGAEVRRQPRTREQGRTRYTDGDRQVSDAEGRVRFAPAARQGVVRWRVAHGGEVYHTGDRYLWERAQRDTNARTRTFLFTDRAIYRPGQTIWFKGIVTRGRERDHRVVPGLATTVKLHDANGEAVAELAVSTDAYGTFQGSFTAPVGGLAGGMELREAHGQVLVRVEEYKRPSFQVTLEPVPGARLGAEATVRGRAATYAGVPVDGARVRWRVARTARLPWWRGDRWSGGLPWGRATEVAEGTATCDADGCFSIRFTPLADGAFPAEADPHFVFQVTADVTDAAGETRSATRAFTLGRDRIAFTLHNGDRLRRDRADSLRFAVHDLEGEPVDVPCTVRIMRLVPPEGIPFRTRIGAHPDRWVMDRATHAARYPNDPATDEDDPLTWPTADTVLHRPAVNARVPLPLPGLAGWDVGLYRVELSATDADGRDVRLSHPLHVIDPEVLYTGHPDKAFHAELLSPAVEPGEKAVLLISSGLPEARVWMEVERAGRIVVQRWITLRNAQQRVELNVLDDDRGGFAVHLFHAARGREQRLALPVRVPWTNKDLRVEWQRFRDRVRPGSAEEWRLRITGADGRPASAQVMATLYDASLDAFVPHQWPLGIWPSYQARRSWSGAEPFGGRTSRPVWRNTPLPPMLMHMPARLNTFGVEERNRVMPFQYLDGVSIRGARSDAVAMMEVDDGDAEAMTVGEEDPVPASGGDAPVVRSDFRETAFFAPDLLTDRDGSVLLRFNLPDALTRWKLLGLAHTPDLRLATFTREAVAQRPLMVMPHLPRLLRAGDRIQLTARVAVPEGDRVEGLATLELFDAITRAPSEEAFGLRVKAVPFVAAPGNTGAVAWTITVPEGIDAVGLRFIVRGGGGPVGGSTVSDAEEHVLPVLSDRMLITESRSLFIPDAGTHTFTLDKLLAQPATPATLRHQGLTLEFTPNPAWTAVQALPYLMEFPHDHAEQLMARYEANRLATHVLERKPALRAVYDQWKAAGTDGFVATLERNARLLHVLLDETPWVAQARDDRQRRERLGLLFDAARMAAEEQRDLHRLRELQLPSGAWPWFAGMAPSRWITQHIVAAFGHLEQLGAADLRPDGPVQGMLKRAVRWLDEELVRAHRERTQALTPAEQQRYRPTAMELHHLYARSFFPRWNTDGTTTAARDHLLERLRATWVDRGLQEQALTMLVLHRAGDREVPALILRSLLERATRHPELGLYWSGHAAGTDWWTFPTETHARLIEAFMEVGADVAAVEAMRLHLLSTKRTTDWGTTTATAAAVHALLLHGMDLLEPASVPRIDVGGWRIDRDTPGLKQEAGTGTLTHTWTGDHVRPDMGRVTVTTSAKGPAWGALHWRYLERIDRVEQAAGPLGLRRELLVKQADGSFAPLVAGRVLSVGDQLLVRLELRTDRWLDFVHLKDTRAAALEPVDVLSGTRYQGGLGYYQSTRDASTHFFFDRLRPGTHVLEYPLRVAHAGDLSEGLATVRCLYAPAFAAHSAGGRLRVEE